MNRTFFVAIALVIIISATLKILRVYYNYHVLKMGQKKKKTEVELNLLNSQISYKQFEKVSKESLVQNSPVRSQGDFMDFISSYTGLNSQIIENKILKMCYGEDNG